MDVDFDAEQGVKPALTRVEPVMFRGMDCAQLAERYVAYRRSTGMDEARHDPDEIRLAAVAGGENA